MALQAKKQAETETDPKEERSMEEGILKRFKGGDEGWGKALLSALGVLVVILSGVVTGYFLSQRKVAAGPSTAKKLQGGAEMISGPKEVGIKDEKVFRDTAKGKISVNDFNEVKEGSHKLLRPGGESQTAYLTSSVIDLNQYLEECVQIWGETFSAQKAGWLMDVGRLKVLDKCPEGL